MRRPYRCSFVLFLVAGPLMAADPDVPEKYLVDYPAVQRFCAPIRSTFFEVTRTEMTVKGKRFRQKLNGGYGLPVLIKQDGKNLIHVGADLGWHQVGEPVFAVADGVVRMSTGPDFADDRKPADRARPADAPMPWGNFVVIEHRTAEGDYYTTVYGHLATRRLVQLGEVVRAGQAIGTIGRQHFRINGGYKPHLHFGVRKGRIAEKGAALFGLLSSEGTRVVARIVDLREDWVQVDLPESVPDQLQIRLGRETTRLVKRDGEYFVPSRHLWGYQRPEFALVGYSLTTDGWLDPVAFLKQHRAHTFPAPYLTRTIKR